MLADHIQGPWLHGALWLAFAFHIGGGTLGLISGSVAVIARKGELLHRVSGNVFFGCLLVMATFAILLAFVVPGQLVNVFIGAFAFYLVATAWLTVRRRDGAIGYAEWIALLVGVVLCAPFAILSFQLATGMTPFFESAVPFKGPVLIAVYSFTAVLAVAAAGDAKLVLNRGVSGAPRIARHLWRMCVGLTLAAGSAFTNGLPRLLPGPFDVPPAFFIPQFVPVGLLVFWMIRVRFTPWVERR